MMMMMHFCYAVIFCVCIYATQVGRSQAAVVVHPPSEVVVVPVGKRIAHLEKVLAEAERRHPHLLKEVIIYTDNHNRRHYEEILMNYPGVTPVFRAFPPFHHHRHMYEEKVIVPTGIPGEELVFIDEVPADYPPFFDPFWEPFFDAFWNADIPLYEGFGLRKALPLERGFFEHPWRESRKHHRDVVHSNAEIHPSLHPAPLHFFAPHPHRAAAIHPHSLGAPHTPRMHRNAQRNATLKAAKNNVKNRTIHPQRKSHRP